MASALGSRHLFEMNSPFTYIDFDSRLLGLSPITTRGQNWTCHVTQGLSSRIYLHHMTLLIPCQTGVGFSSFSLALHSFFSSAATRILVIYPSGQRLHSSFSHLHISRRNMTFVFHLPLLCLARMRQSFIRHSRIYPPRFRLCLGI